MSEEKMNDEVIEPTEEEETETVEPLEDMAI